MFMKMMKRKILLAGMLLAGLLMGTEASAAYDYSMRYVKEHLLYSNGDEVNVIDVDLEWPEIIDGADMEPLTLFLTKTLFGISSRQMDEAYEQFKAQFGKPVTEQFGKLPDDGKMCYADLSLKALSRAADRFISFEVNALVNPAESSSHRERRASMLVTYDLIGKKVLQRDDVLRRDRISESFGQVDILLPENLMTNTEDGLSFTDPRFLMNLSIEDACLIDKFLLLSISCNDGDGVPYGYRKIFMPSAMKPYMTKAAQQLMKPTKAKLQKSQMVTANQLDGEPVYNSVEEKPVFALENEPLKDYLARNIRTVNDNVNGRHSGQVTVEFVIDREGLSREVRVVKSLTPAYDREAVRVVKSLPRWKPARIGGNAVNYRSAIAILFNESQE